MFSTLAGALAGVCVEAALLNAAAAQAPQARAERPAEEIAPRDDIAASPAADLGVVFDALSDEAVAARIFSYLENVDTLQGDFQQIAPSGAITTGEFQLDRPGQLRFAYDDPSPLLIIANGGVVYVQDRDLETTDSYPVGKTPLKFLLRKDIADEDALVRAVDRGIDSVALTLASNDAETEGEITLILAAPDFSLRRWIVRDPQNGTTVVSLENVAVGEDIPNRLFRAPDAGGSFLKN